MVGTSIEREEAGAWAWATSHWCGIRGGIMWGGGWEVGEKNSRSKKSFRRGAAKGIFGVMKVGGRRQEWRQYYAEEVW